MVGSLFGDQAATAFRGLWTDHVTAFFNYSRGLATERHRRPGTTRARSWSTFENQAWPTSSPRRRRDGCPATRPVQRSSARRPPHRAGRRLRGQRLRRGPTTLYREAYAHTFGLGHTLAATLLPPDQAAALDQPSWRLRSALDRLLGEHVALAVAALRAGATNSPDFPAAADALERQHP